MAAQNSTLDITHKKMFFNLVVTLCKLHNVHVRAVQSLAVPKSNGVKILTLFKERHFLSSSN